MFIFGPIAQIVRSKLFITGDAEATAHNIMRNEFLFRLGFASDLIMMVIFLLLPLVLYKLLNSVNRPLALVMVLLAAVSVPINMLNLLNEFSSLQLLSSGGYVRVFETAQIHAQVMFYYELYLQGYEIANIFFGLWLVPLGLLVYKAEFLPKVLGISLVIGGCGLFVSVMVYFLFPGHETADTILQIPQMIAESAFALWILIRGINESKVRNLQPIMLNQIV